MNKIVKLQSEQSGPFNSSKNLIDFDLMGGRQYDLRKAYVNMVGTMTQTDTTPGTGEGVYNWEALWKDKDGNNTNYRFPNVALVKNARMTTDKTGTLEDIRRVDILRTQLKQYTENEDDMRGQSYKDLSQARSQGNLKFGPNIEFNSVGSVKSVVNDVNVQIPLKDMFELGNMSNLPLDKLGNARIHLEMNLDKLAVVGIQGTGTRAAEFGNTKYTEFEDVVAAGDLTTLVSTMKFSDLKYSPFWVGQKLSFSGTGGGGGASIASVEKVITEISYNKTTQKLTLTLASSLITIGAGESLTAITCDGVDADSISIEWTEAQIVLEESGTSMSMDELQYSTYLNEEDNGNALTSFSRQYQVEEECFNLYVCLPDNSDLLCVNTNANQYEDFRLRNNNVDLTDRSVDYQSPLYKDRLAMTLLNANLPLKNLIEQKMDVQAGFNSRYTTTEKKLIFIGNPLPITPMKKLVQISISGNSAGAGVGTLQLYKQVIKSIKL